MTYTAWFDGRYVSNTDSSFAFIVLKDKKTVYSFSAPLLNVLSSEDVEAAGLLYLLKYIKQQNIQLSHIYTDCSSLQKNLLSFAKKDTDFVKECIKPFLFLFTPDNLHTYIHLIEWRKRDYNLAHSSCLNPMNSEPFYFYSDKQYNSIKNSSFNQNINMYLNSIPLSKIPVGFFENRKIMKNSQESITVFGTTIRLPYTLVLEYQKEFGFLSSAVAIYEIKKSLLKSSVSRRSNSLFFYFDGVVYGIKKNIIFFYGKTNFDIHTNNSPDPEYGFLKPDSILRKTFHLPKKITVQDTEIFYHNSLPNGILADVLVHFQKKNPKTNAFNAILGVLNNGKKYTYDGVDFFILGKKHIFCINDTVVFIIDTPPAYAKYSSFSSS